MKRKCRAVTSKAGHSVIAIFPREASAIQNLSLIPIYPVSASKAARAKNLIGRFYSMKPNVMEAEVLSGLRVETEADLARVGDWFLSQGLEQLFITLNKDGVYYKSKEKEGILRPRGDLRLVSATGAGDSFSAAILLGCVRGLDIEEIARMGMAAASIAMESEQAVNRCV